MCAWLKLIAKVFTATGLAVYVAYFIHEKETAREMMTTVSAILCVNVTKCTVNFIAKHSTFIHRLSGNVTFINPQWLSAAHSCELQITENWTITEL